MKNKLLISSLFIFVYLLGIGMGYLLFAGKGGRDLGNIIPIFERTLDRYTIENLSKTIVPAGTIKIEREIAKEPLYTSSIFKFNFSPSLDSKTKVTTGLINIPEGDGPFPLVLMLRGYVDKEIFQSGVGTNRVGEVFSKNGFITLAPDFPGYGGSDTESTDPMEARFQTYTTTLSLLDSIDQISAWDGKNVFIWGHSNGGQIALTVLEITGKEYPTTLWAPVSKSFPYSILYYTDESEDRGKYLRSEIAKFEDNYDPDLYSLDLYLDRIKAPIQLHQGTADDAVPVSWSDELAEKLDKRTDDSGKPIELNYFKYQSADHNLQPSWNTVVARDLVFFRNHVLKENE